MYYPYLRSKQNEMLALRAMAEQKHYACITPIIEPIKYPDPSLIKATETMAANDICFAMVINPQSRAITPEDFSLLLSSIRSNYIPTFLCDGNLKDVIRQIDEGQYNEVMLAFKESIDDTKDGFEELVSHPSVKTVVGGLGRSLKKQLKSRGVSVVTFKVDAFRAVSSNSQYAGIEDEKYSEEHAFYEEDGFDGFADFCVLPKEIPDGGMTPTTLAIHLTYKKNNEEIWVHHFLSDTRYGRENIQNKFREAAIHVGEFFVNHKKTQAVQELLDCLSNNHYPGLGVLKKYSIWNHLELVNSILEEQKNA